jgi:hypothetical protein
MERERFEIRAAITGSIITSSRLSPARTKDGKILLISMDVSQFRAKYSTDKHHSIVFFFNFICHPITMLAPIIAG